MSYKKIDNKVSYSLLDWGIFKNLRRKAVEIIDFVKEISKKIIIHGSLARGDVNEKSNIELIFLEPIKSDILIKCIKRKKLSILSRKIIMLTPNSLPCYELELSYIFPIIIIVPMFDPTPYDIELYKFGGYINLEQLNEGTRNPGINASIQLIEPTDVGHNLRLLRNVGNEELSNLGIPERVIEDKLRYYDKLRSSKPYVKIKIMKDESIEKQFMRLLSKNPKIVKYLEASGYETKY